jgi:hypothetical protein
MLMTHIFILTMTVLSLEAILIVAVVPYWTLIGAGIGVGAGGSCFSSITFWTLDGASVGVGAGGSCFSSITFWTLDGASVGVGAGGSSGGPVLDA